MITLEVDTSYAEALFSDLGRELDADRLMDGAGVFMLDRILARFRAEVDQNGNPWIPSQAALRENRATLYRSGRLYRSIDVYGRGNERDIESRGVPYAMDHNFGIGQVERRFLGFDQAGHDRDALTEYLEDRINTLIDRVGG